jgi:hypothetical protein
MNTGPRQFKFKPQHTLGGDRPVVDISRRGQTRAAVGLGEDHRKIPVIVLDGPLLNDPICQTNVGVNWAIVCRQEYERTVFGGVSIKQSII